MSVTAASPWYLVALAAAAGYCIIGLQQKSGWFDLVNAFGASHPTQLPGTGLDSTLRTEFMGFPAVDFHIAGVIRSFYAMVSGEHQPTTVFSFWFTGQLLAIQALQMLEGLRAGNRGKLISRTWLWGAIYQTMTVGITTPLWVAVWLWTSPIASLSATTPGPTLTAALATDEADLSVLPHSFIWGNILPTVLAAMPSPAIVSYDQKVTYLLIWQFFPILTSVAHFFLSTAARRLRPRGKTAGLADGKTDNDPTAALQRRLALAHRLRWVYIFVLAVTAAVHTLTVLFVFFPALRPPSLAPAHPAAVDFASVFVPALTPFSTTAGPVSSIAEGVLTLLQYDAYFGAGAVLYWASRQFWASTEAPSLSSILSVLAGPAGAALILVWRRDERLLLSNTPKAKAN